MLAFVTDRQFGKGCQIIKFLNNILGNGHNDGLVSIHFERERFERERLERASSFNTLFNFGKCAMIDCDSCISIFC